MYIKSNFALYQPIYFQPDELSSAYRNLTSRNQKESSKGDPPLINNMRSSFKAIAECPLHGFGIVPKTTGLILQIPPELRKLELKDLIV